MIEEMMLETYPNYTKASKIVNFIMKNPDWQKQFEDLKIKVKYDKNGLAIFNYEVAADFFNEIVQEARGIIIDMNELEVVCFPFRKFGNLTEEYADKIDWSSARVLEKEDGSITKLFWNKYEDKWQWATNSMIDAREATCESVLSNSFYDIIKKCKNLKDIDLNALNKDYTYIFELTSPENKVVIRYPEYKLYHIGTRNNKTGQEYEVNIDIEKPKTYEIKNIDEALEFVSKMNTEDRVEHEGFVVVDKNYNRIKIKSPEYVFWHHLSNGVGFSKTKVLELLRSDDFDLKTMVKNYPEYREVFDFYIKETEKLEKDVTKYIENVRRLYEENGNNKKELALAIKDDKFSGLGFKSIGNEKDAKTLLAEMTRAKYEKLIPDFVQREPQPGGGLFD